MIIRLILLIVWFVVFLFAPVMARQHGMHVEVQAGQIAIGGEFVPRFPDLPSQRVVAVGANDAVSGGTYDYIEVGGTLTLSGVVSVTHLFVLPGGTLIIECGATVIGRSVPIDTTRDPFQWGNGLLSFGTLRMMCPEKTPFVPIADAASGATTLTLVTVPTGWAVGDEVMLPDTRQMFTGGVREADLAEPRRESNATITAISGTSLTLSKPLAFARASIVRPDGSVVLRPRIANLTRPTVIRSENPAGTRWHIAHVGGASSWDVSGVAFIGLGRTKNLPVDNTTSAHVGTNQIGRYAFHIHHAASSLQTRRIADSVFIGQGVAKWGGVTVHQSHDVEVLRTVCVDTPSGCLVTEDGNEVRNVFRGNFAANIVGNMKDSRTNVAENCSGCESAYWFRGVGNIYEDNEVWNATTSGWNLFNQAWLANGLPIPSTKGGTGTVTPNLDTMVPISMSGNVAAANHTIGIEYWSVGPFPNTRFIPAHNGLQQVGNGPSDRIVADVLLVDSSVICKDGKTTGINSSLGYTLGVETLRTEVRGCSQGVAQGIGRVYGRFTDSVFQNEMDFFFEQGGPATTWTRVRFEPFLSSRIYIGKPLTPTWSGGTAPLPGDGGEWALREDGGSWIIEDWQGTGTNYKLASPSSVSTALSWYHSNEDYGFLFPPPECGATLGETFANCGMSFGGEAFTAGEQVTLEGLVGLVGLPLPRPPKPLPRAIMTMPTTRGPSAIIYDGNRVWLQFVLTGNPTQADNQAYYSIDGGPRLVTTGRRGGALEAYYVGGSGFVITPGSHTVRAWRERNGVEVPGSSMMFGYVIGAGGPPPPPPPTPVNCVLSAATSTVSGWSLNGTTYTRTTTETKTVTTAPANGGTPCQP